MAQFIRCPSCSFCIAPYIEFFELAKQAIYAKQIFSENSEYKDYDPEKLALNPGSTKPLEEIFVALNIENRCCRMRILTNMALDKLYI